MGDRAKKSVKNIYTGLIFRLANLLLSFASRYIFIEYLGDACLGLNGLFTTILTLFSLAELGIGSAITFYMYKPIAERDEEQLRQLVQFYKRCYRVIGYLILVIGLLLIPLLPKLINLETESGYNNYVIYLLYLANTVLTYLLSYPATVLEANQEQYTVNRNASLFQLLIFTGDIVSLSVTGNYLVYLSLRLFLQVMQNARLYFIAKKRYPYTCLAPKAPLDRSIVKKMFRDVYSIFVVKLSTLLIESTDNLFISVFLGTVLVGYNSNYMLFYGAARSIVETVIRSFTAAVGDMAATESKSSLTNVFHRIDGLNFCLSFFASVCLFSFLNPFITIIWGSARTFSVLTVILISFNFYLVTCLNTIFLFRQSLGMFQYCTYNTLYTALLNIVLDYLFVRRLGVMGLYLATVISNLTFGIWPFIKSIFEVGLETDAKGQITKTVLRFFYLLLCYFAVHLATSVLGDGIPAFCLRVLITLAVIAIALIVYALLDSDFKEIMLEYYRKIIGKLQHGI